MQTPYTKDLGDPAIVSYNDSAVKTQQKPMYCFFKQKPFLLPTCFKIRSSLHIMYNAGFQ
jgi:hypothetical protein